MTPERFARLKHVLRQRQPELTVLTDDVHKAHNVSAILRTCDAVGVGRIDAVSSSGEFRRHHMMAGGSKRWVEVRVQPSIEAAYAALRIEGFRILATQATASHGAEPSGRSGVSNAIDFRAVDYTQKTAIVLGAELEGASDYAIEQADACIAIPMHGMVESLNVSVAAAVILFEAQRQLLEAGRYETCRIDAEDFARTLFEWAHPEIAQRCRERGLPYPAMDEDGTPIENPFRRKSSR